MGVYVPGWNKPERCRDCYFDDLGCMLVDGEIDHRNCPLKEVPAPHGDLIDRAVLSRHIADWQMTLPPFDMTETDKTIYGTLDGVFDVIADKDAVIEAEGQDE